MTDPMAQVDAEVIGCLLSARDFAIRSDELAGGLFAAVAEMVEVPDGYAYRLASAERQVESLLAFIADTFNSRIGVSSRPDGCGSRPVRA